MRKMAFKRVRPINENDKLEIEMEWSQVIPERNFFYLKCSHPEHEFYSEFYQWAQHCEGRWYIPRLYGIRDNCTNEDGLGIYFQNESDKVKFILKFM